MINPPTRTKHFRLNDRVTTPNGPAYFIGILNGGERVQVSRMVPAVEFSREQCERIKPAIQEMSHLDFLAWQKAAKICVNEIYPLTEIGSA